MKNPKKVLFIAPKYLNIYIDIVKEFENQGYVVDFLPEQCYKDDPLNVRGYVRYGKIWVNKRHFRKKNRKRWVQLLSNNTYNKVYDVLFVLDGQSIDSYLFEELRRRNSCVFCVNYLFDTTKGVYEFQYNFPYFDKVVTFDPEESAKYNIGYMPIYWVNEKVDQNYSTDIFGFGALSQERYELFSMLKYICETYNYSFYLKLLRNFRVHNFFLYKVRCLIRKWLHISNNDISVEAIKSDFVASEGLQPSEFRKYIANSRVVIDTCAPHQKGLTARFMWAVGLGRKVITTNRFAEHTNIYCNNQVLVYDSSKKEEVKRFIESPISVSTTITDLLYNYRIDNWVISLLNR